MFEEDIFLEICGDDSRANVLTQRGWDLMDVDNGWKRWLDIWKERLPWEVKIEGSVAFPHEWREDGRLEFQQGFADRMALMPPLVARNLFVVDDVLWSPLWNAGRCVRKLMSEGANKMDGPLGRTPEEEFVLRISAFMSLKLLVWWHRRGIIYSPTVQCLLDNGWYTKQINTLVTACVSGCWLEARAHRTPASWYE